MPEIIFRHRLYHYARLFHLSWHDLDPDSDSMPIDWVNWCLKFEAIEKSAQRKYDERAKH
jgi:hypothetical protein